MIGSVVVSIETRRDDGIDPRSAIRGSTTLTLLVHVLFALLCHRLLVELIRRYLPFLGNALEAREKAVLAE